VLWRTWVVHTVHVDTLIILLHITNTRIMPWEERKVDRLQINPKGAAKEALTCAVPMQASQTNLVWQRAREMSSACEMGC